MTRLRADHEATALSNIDAHNRRDISANMDATNRSSRRKQRKTTSAGMCAIRVGTSAVSVAT
jgi:hypothetical protein